MGASSLLEKIRYRTARSLVRRFPSARSWPAGLTNRVIRLVLGPQIIIPPPAETHDAAGLRARTDEFNAASETYFADYSNPEFILNKPYSDPGEFPRYLFNMGVLFHWLRLSPGDAVLDLGAGTCWVSHFLNRYGCKTFSVDVSSTALDLGRRLFEGDPKTRWDVEPEFVTYDGHRFPLPDACCDRIVVHDAFHHVPNQEEILREMARVLRDGGIVAMVEPGRRHSLTADSRREMDETGVLENDIVVENLAQLAQRCGFSRASVVPINLSATVEVEARDLTAFLKGKGFQQFWSRQAQYLMSQHFILLYRGDYVPTTRRPETVAAQIEVVGAAAKSGLEARSGEGVRLRCRLRNRGNTRWLPESAGDPGRTRLGAHLLSAEGKTLEHDWFRAVLDGAVDPGQTVELEVELPGLAAPGEYRVKLDMVAEGVLWFSQQGSETLELRLRVGG